MITHQISEITNLNRLLSGNTATIKQLVMLGVICMVEANIDMIADDPDSFTTKRLLDTAFNTPLLKQQVGDYLEDVLSDIKEQALATLNEVDFTATVRAVEYNAAGDIEDVTVDVKTF